MGASQRAGLPISVKLVVVTSIVVAVAVGLATWFSQKATTELTEQSLATRRQTGQAAIVRESELVVQAVAASVATPLAGSQYNDIAPLLAASITADKKSGDNRIQWLLVTDASGQVVGKAGEAPTDDKVKELDGKLASGEKNGDVAHATTTSATDWVYGAAIKLGGNDVGAVRMGVSTAGLEQELGARLAAANDAAEKARNKMLMVSIAVLAIGIVLAALYGVALAKPIKALTVHANQIAAGDLNTRVEENRRDELGVLARTFNLMTEEIRHLLVEQSQKASLEKEMSLARQVQQAMLPPHALDQHGYVKIAGYCQPASMCGGDWWTYRKMEHGRVLMVIGDATGHGIHSAMIAATARGAVEALSGIDERLLTPETVLRAIDSAIRQVGDHNVLMTAFAALFDSATGALHYANAGQNFPYVIKLGPQRLLEEASIIAASGNPLGDRNIPVAINQGAVQLRPGDLFLCFTDGVVERANPSGKLFGDRRLRGTFTGLPLYDGNSLLHLRDTLVTTLDGYGEGAAAEDDITFVLCQYDPPVSRSSVGRGVA